MFHEEQILKISDVYVREIESQQVLNNMLVTKFRHSMGTLTLFNAPAPLGSGDDLTVTRLGKRWWDAGLYLIERGGT